MDLDARLTRKQAAEQAGVRPEVVGMWKVRGHLNTDEDGLYRLGDVLRVERQTRYSPNNRRTAPGGNGRIRLCADHRSALRRLGGEMALRRCLGVDGAGHRADGTRCGSLTQATRCPGCGPMHETQRTQTRRVARPYTAQERDRRAASVQAWVAGHGWTCPGWRRDRHAVEPGDLTADHPQAVHEGGDEGQLLDVLCRSCNSSKGTSSADYAR